MPNKAKSPERIAKDRMKSLRGLVGFNYNLNEPMTPARRAKITKAWNELKPMRDARHLVPPRRKGESQRNYKARVNELKRAYGQEGSPARGVFLHIPAKARVRYGKDQIRIQNAATKMVEKFIPLDGDSKKAFVADPGQFIRDLVAEHSFAGKPTFDRIAPMHGTYRGTGIREIEVDALEAFIDQIVEDLGRYGKDSYAVTGFVLTTE